MGVPFVDFPRTFQRPEYEVGIAKDPEQMGLGDCEPEAGQVSHWVVKRRRWTPRRG